MPRFSPWLRLFARYIGTQRDIAHSLRRIADHVDPPGLQQDLPPERARVADSPDVDFVDAFKVEEKLRRDLGREPDPEEILRALRGDLLESADEPPDLQARRRSPISDFPPDV